MMQHTLIPCPRTPAVLALLVAEQADSAAFARYTDHIQTCEQCQEALRWFDPHAIFAVKNTGASAHLDRHSPIGTIPDKERLIAYADVLMEQHGADARQRFPETATHLASCALCRERLAEQQANLAWPPQPPNIPTVDDAAEEEPPIDVGMWHLEYLAGRARRMLETHQIAMSPRDIQIAGRLQHFIPPGGLPYAPDLEHLRQAPVMRSGGTQPLVQTLILELQTPDVERVPWVRVVVDLARMAGGRGVECVMHAQWIAFAGDPAPRNAAGLAWRVEQPGADQPALVSAGVTDTAGMAWWSFAETGPLMVLIESDGAEWALPLELSHVD